MVKFSKFVKFGDKDDRNQSFRQPVVVGKEYDVEIEEIGSKGDGIARIKGFVIFVPNTNKGEKCRIKIKETRRKFGVGEKIIEEGKEKKTEKAAEKKTEKAAEKKTEKKEKAEKSKETKDKQEKATKKVEKSKEKAKKKAGEKVED